MHHVLESRVTETRPLITLAMMIAGLRAPGAQLAVLGSVGRE